MWKPGTAGAAFCALGALLIASCQATSVANRTSAGFAESSTSQPTSAIARLAARVDTFRVSGTVRTDTGLLLPEQIVIEVRSELCVESRKVGGRFWSLSYDTCFVYTAVDTVDELGRYSLVVPCLDADKKYESSHPFGDYRLVQRGPVSFLADSDGGWQHQETFSSSRDQIRDLILTLEPEVFYVVRDEGVVQEKRATDSKVLARFEFGAEIAVVRFQEGWAECLLDKQLGWMEMRSLGTKEQMELKAPLYRKESTPNLDRS